MNATHDVWTDPELLELVRDEPELAAIADALTQSQTAAAPIRSRRRVVLRLRLVTLAAAVAAVVAIALVAPWQRSGGGSLSDLALAAVGSDPVLHVVAETPTGAQLVEIQTGTTRPVTQQEEIWYYADRGLRRDIVLSGGTIVDDTLETPQGGYTPSGIVYDCAWIAAHPAEATKAHVSCNPSGDNGTVPRVVPRPKPTLDPGLAGFVDGYRHALAAGWAQEAGSSELNGEQVDWLVLQTRDGSERVALDHITHKPVLLERDPSWRLRIVSIETIPYSASQFRRPTPDELPAQPMRGEATDAKPLPLDGPAIAAAAPDTLWAGPAVAGLPLVKAEQQTLTSTFANGSRPQTGTGLELGYGSLGPHGHLDILQPNIEVLQAPSRALAFAYRWGFIRGSLPPVGWVATITDSDPALTTTLGFTVVGRTYVTIQAPSSELLLEAVRSLRVAAR